MRTIAIIAVSLFTSVACGELIPKPEATKVSGRIDWVLDYAEGQKLSESTGKPMFVVFRCER